jgi:hypothetical protein
MQSNHFSIRFCVTTVLVAVCILFSTQVVSAQCALSCGNLVQVSIDQAGQATINPQTVLLSASAGCTSFAVELYTPSNQIVPNTVTCAQVGQTLTTKVIETTSGNYCWGSVKIEDKLKPTLTVADATVWCTQLFTPTQTGYPTATDNCTVFTAANLPYTDQFIDLPCNTSVGGVPMTAKVLRTWTATDASGNSTATTQTIYLKRATVANVVFPLNRDGFDAPALDCKDDPNNLVLTGVPTVGGMPVVNGAFCDLVANHTDQIVAICAPAGIRILREWRVIDYCTNQFQLAIQIINVEDKKAPVIAPIANITVGTSSTACSGTVNLPVATATDDCGTVSIVPTWSFGTGYTPYQNVPTGSYTVTYKATDNCGNFSTKTMTVTVKDDDVPIAVCSGDVQISLNLVGIATVNVATFDDGSTDNCGVAFLKVSRDSTTWLDNVDLTCGDINGITKIFLRVTDNAGLSNVCTTNVEVLDKVKPVITCPAAKTILCTDDHNDLTVTGKATAVDNCTTNPVITFSQTVNLSNCGTGTIARKFQAIDAKGNASVCIQTITKIDTTPVKVTFPIDKTLYGCQVNTSPSVTGEPKVTGNECEPIGMTYTDKTFTVANNGTCYKIIRTWDVIDWCTYTVGNPSNAGHFIHAQVLYVTDTIAPVLNIPANATVGIVGSNCDGIAVLADATATDCSGNVTITNDSPFATAKKANASGTYPQGIYNITYTATDACGNTTTKVQILTVKDTKKPTPVCLQGIAAPLMQDGTLSITPDLIENGGGFDNCTAYKDLTFAITPNKFTCKDLGSVQLTMTVTDKAGNSDYCLTYIDIQDNANKVCNTATSASVAGLFMTDNGEVLKNVIIDIKENLTTAAAGSNIAFAKIDTSDVSGAYQFDGLERAKNYTITPHNNDKPSNGVSTLDLVILRKHILNITPITSPYKLIAADVNKSGTVTMNDIVQMRQIILNITPQYLNNNSWRFIDAKHKFGPTPLTETFSETIKVDNLQENRLTDNFMAIKIGDLNNSVNLQLVEPRNEGITLNTDDQTFKAGDEITVPITATNFKDLLGYQFALSFDPQVLEYKNIAPQALKINEGNVGKSQLDNGILLTNWDSEKPQTVSDQEQLFTLKFKAKQSGSLKQMLQLNTKALMAECYNEDLERQNVSFVFNVREHEKPTYTISQNNPNPFKDDTQITFTFPQAADGTFTITDLNGRVVYTKSEHWDAGEQHITVNKSDIGTSGIYFYRIQTSDVSLVKKMIVE